MQAAMAMRLSAPKDARISERSAILPLPDSGRMSAKGIISGGIFKKVVIGERSVQNASIAPDSLSIADRESMATRGGNMEMTVFIPFSAPSKNTL